MSSCVLSSTSNGVIGAVLSARREPFVVGKGAAALVRDFDGVEPVRNATGCDGGGGGGRSGVGGT